LDDKVKRNIINGDRLEKDEGEYLLNDVDLLELAPLADFVRRKHNPSNAVTYVVDTNLNYTNLCDAYCSFCAFYRTDPKDPSAYTYTVSEIMQKIQRVVPYGVRTVLMQGGLNSEIPFSYYIDMVKETIKRFPLITPHYWSAPEIIKMSEVSGKTTKSVLESLFEAGQRTMPGGGSEILSNKVKKKISRFKPKNSVEQWTEIHADAHEVGFKTTATMMYGHVETDADIIETLGHIRDVQDKSNQYDNGGGFTAFIPWSFKKDFTALSKKVINEAGPNRYLKIIAVSRIFLDNIPHIQASWFSEGKKTGQVALKFGADDFGGTLFDENVMLAAGFYNRTSKDELVQMIEDAGYTATERLTDYTLV